MNKLWQNIPKFSSKVATLLLSGIALICSSRSSNLFISMTNSDNIGSVSIKRFQTHEITSNFNAWSAFAEFKKLFWLMKTIAKNTYFTHSLSTRKLNRSSELLLWKTENYFKLFSLFAPLSVSMNATADSGQAGHKPIASESLDNMTLYKLFYLNIFFTCAKTW